MLSQAVEERVPTQSKEDEVEDANINQTGNAIDEMQNLESKPRDLKSLSELESENEKLEENLKESKDQVLELKRQIEDLTQRLHDVGQLFSDDDLPSDKRTIFREILKGENGNTSVFHDKHVDHSPEAHGKPIGDVVASSTADQPHRSNSELSFQLEELNLENEDLKRNVDELEQKIRKTIEEHEIRMSVFNENLERLVEKFLTEQRGEVTQEDDSKLDMAEEINNIRMEKTSNELLEEYVGIVLRHKLTAPSPDIVDVNFCSQLQSFESLLDLEVFDGRVFDGEMKDEVKQVLRDKERELLVAYTLEKLRDEIRHRGMTQATLEELERERERDFCVNQAVNEILKVHLGISEDGVEHEEDIKEAINKVLREHLGIKGGSRELENVSQGELETEAKSEHDFESLKAEKDDLERNLQELHEYFEKERKEWMEKLQSSLSGGSSDPEDKDRVIESLQAQKVMMEQILNAERFHLSRLYYIEMKEELELCLKKHQYNRSTKIEKER